MKEKKQAKKFSIVMAVTEKKINLEEKKIKLKERNVEFMTASKDTKMLTMRMDELNDDVTMIVRVIHVKMFKLLAAEMETAKEEDGEEKPGRRQTERESSDNCSGRAKLPFLNGLLDGNLCDGTWKKLRTSVFFCCDPAL